MNCLEIIIIKKIKFVPILQNSFEMRKIEG